jgi:hypothetical protein
MTAPPLMAARPRPAPLPGQWTFWADTLVGGLALGPVQASAFRAGRKLSGFGNGTISLIMPSGIPPERVLALWTYRIWAYFEGLPWWCGVPTGITDTGSAAVGLTLTELPGYLAHRQWDVFPSQRFTQVEQTQIARTLAQPVEDVGVVIVTDPGPGFLRDREYEGLEGGEEGRAGLLHNLSNVISGPEYATVYTASPGGLPVCTLRIAYPRVGGPTGLGVTVPGSAVGYQASWDSDNLRTRTYAVGDLPEDAPETARRPVAVEDRPQLERPRLDRADDYPGVILQTTLVERANTAAGQYAEPVLDLSASAVVTAPPLHGYAPGDDVTVSIVSPLLPGGLDVPGRLIEVEVDAATAVASWTVAVTIPPPRARATLNDRIDRLDRVASGAFRTRLQLL